MNQEVSAKLSSIRFHGNPSRSSRVVSCAQLNGQTVQTQQVRSSGRTAALYHEMCMYFEVFLPTFLLQTMNGEKMSLVEENRGFLFHSCFQRKL
jgi:hypothetical protein